MLKYSEELPGSGFGVLGDQVSGCENGALVLFPVAVVEYECSFACHSGAVPAAVSAVLG